MKKHFFITIFVLAVFLSNSQTYHPLVDTNKVWSTSHIYIPGTPANSDFIKIQGDTTIDNHVYNQVWKCIDTTQSVWTPYGFIKEYNKKVYYLSWSGGAPNNLIYDFGVEVGDTISLFADPMGFYLVVDSIDSFVLLSGESRTRFNLTCYGVGTPFGHDTWIEGIGSLFGVLQSGTCMLVGDNPQLICFTENDTLKYFNTDYDDCYIVTGIDDPGAKIQAVKIFPNPSSGVITVTLYDPSLLPLSIFFIDPAGREILEKEIKETETIIDLSKVTGSSFVFYQVIGSLGYYSEGKIIIHNY